MTTPRPTLRRATGALALLSVIWGYNWVVMKRALDYSGAFEFTAFRGVLTTVLLFAILAMLRHPMRPSSWRVVLLVGLFQTVGNGGLAGLALISGAAGRTAVIVYLMPFWTLLIARFVLQERMRGVQWVAVGLAGAGLALVIAPWTPGTATLAALAALGSGICWSLSAIAVKRLQRGGTAALLALTAWQMLLGSLVLCAIAWAFPQRPFTWTPYFFWALAYNVVLVGALGWMLWLYALDRLPAGTASLGTLAIPVLGALAAAVELGERPPGHEIAGMVFIAAGLGLLAWLAQRERRRNDPMAAQE
jgi:drug/metabolite transporter (DMT)-like permease